MGTKGRSGNMGVTGEVRRAGDKCASSMGSSVVLAEGLERHSSSVRRAGTSAI